MYPSTSPYMYVLGKPTALVDPNGMSAWIPPSEQGGAWTAEAGDSPGSLAVDAGISQSAAEGVMRGYNSANGNSRSSDMMVYKGDQVTIPGSESSESSPPPTSGAALQHTNEYHMKCTNIRAHIKTENQASTEIWFSV